MPLLLSAFLKKLGKDDDMAYKLAGAMVVNAVVATLLLHQYFQRTYRTGMRLKSAAISLVFDKALVARTAGAEDEGALVTNLMSVDAQRLQDNMTYMFTIVSGVYQIVATLYLLYGQLGPASFGGLAVMLIFMPVTQRIVLVTRDYQKVVLEYKDRRIKLQSEALSGMKIVKLYGWEPPLGRELDRLRDGLAAEVHRAAQADSEALILTLTLTLARRSSTGSAMAWRPRCSVRRRRTPRP